jgi:hypothetical protein
LQKKAAQEQQQEEEKAAGKLGSGEAGASDGSNSDKSKKKGKSGQGEGGLEELGDTEGGSPGDGEGGGAGTWALPVGHPPAAETKGSGADGGDEAGKGRKRPPEGGLGGWFKRLFGGAPKASVGPSKSSRQMPPPPEADIDGEESGGG